MDSSDFGPLATAGSVSSAGPDAGSAQSNSSGCSARCSHLPESSRPILTRSRQNSRTVNIIIALLFVSLLAFACYAGYCAFFSKGALCIAGGALLLLVLFRRIISSRLSWKPGGDAACGNRSRKGSVLCSNLFVLAAAAFLLAFPYAEFLQAVGLIPGLAFIVVLAFLLQHTRGASSIPGLIGIMTWLLLFWLWGEAGRQGFVVMPVDVPSGAELAQLDTIPSTQSGVHLKDARCSW
jgi:hypothetical protein